MTPQPAGGISRLMLGTAQFGLDYGVANRTGQPTYETAREILACAIAGGVTACDTAAAYGDSEEVLGRALRELGAADRLTVVTKIAPLPPGLSASEANAAVEQSVSRSLQRLRLDVLPVCLFHREENLPYLDALQREQARGRVRRIGISAVSPQGALAAVGTAGVEAVQIPTNLLDRRFAAVGAAALARNTDLFARSVYLQGLILMDDADTPQALQAVIPIRQRLRELARAAGLTLAELAVRYNLSLRELRYVLVGVDTPQQMRENLALFARGPLPADLLAAVRAAVPELPSSILDPWRWPPLCRNRQ